MKVLKQVAQEAWTLHFTSLWHLKFVYVASSKTSSINGSAQKPKNPLIIIINLIQLYCKECNKLQGKIMIYHCHVIGIWD